MSRICDRKSSGRLATNLIEHTHRQQQRKNAFSVWVSTVKSASVANTRGNP